MINKKEITSILIASLLAWLFIFYLSPTLLNINTQKKANQTLEKELAHKIRLAKNLSVRKQFSLAEAKKNLNILKLSELNPLKKTDLFNLKTQTLSAHFFSSYTGLLSYLSKNRVPIRSLDIKPQKNSLHIVLNFLIYSTRQSSYTAPKFDRG